MANSDINNGAQYLAALNLDDRMQKRLRSAASEMGVTEAEAYKLIARAQKKLDRKAPSNSNIDRVVDGFIRRAKGIAGLNADMPGDIDEYRTVPNSQVQQGEEGNQDQLQNFGGRDGQGNIKDVDQQLKEMAGAEGKVDPNVIERSLWDKAQGAFVTDEFYAADGVPIPADFQEAAKNKDFGIQVPNQFAPAQQVMREELARLQQGIDKYGANAFPGGIDLQRGVSKDISGFIRNNEVPPLPPGVAGPNAPGASLGRPYVAQIPGAAGVAGQLEDQLYGSRGAEQALARELVKQDRQRQNAAQVKENNLSRQAEARIIGQDFQIGGRGTRADEALAKIGHIEGIGHAKIGQDFRVSNKPPIDSTYPDTVPIDLAKGYADPYTRSSGPLQRQQQWLVDQVPSFMSPNNLAGTYPSVAIDEQLGAAQAAIQKINFGTKKNPMHMQLDDGAIRNLDDLQEAVDAAVSLGRQQGIKFYNYNPETKFNDYAADPDISSVLQKGGMNADQMTDVARALYALEASRRSSVNQVSKTFFNNGMGQPSRPVLFGGTHASIGGGMVGLAGLNGETVEGQKIKPLIKRLTGKLDRDGNVLPKHEQLTGALLNDARMNLIAGVRGKPVSRAHFARKPLMGPGPVRLFSEDQTYDRMGEVNGQYANDIMRRWEQSQGTNPDGFGQRVERQRNMDPAPGFNPGPDPWSTPPATGNGISNKIRQSNIGLLPPSPPSREYTGGGSFEADGPSPMNRERRRRAAQGRVDSKFRTAVRNRARIQRGGQIGLAAGGAVAGLAGLDALIDSESDKRKEEVAV